MDEYKSFDDVSEEEAERMFDDFIEATNEQMNELRESEMQTALQALVFLGFATERQLQAFRAWKENGMKTTGLSTTHSEALRRLRANCASIMRAHKHAEEVYLYMTGS